MKTVTGWHFAGTTLRDGRPLPKKGETIRHDGNVSPCKSGLHASKRAIDALQYAPGCMVARVRLSGEIVPHGEPVDKYAASKRTNLTDYVDVCEVLVAFARRCALRALRVHAADALRQAGLTEHADKLAALPDDCDMIDALDAARHARHAARYARHAARDARDASYAALDAASDASHAARGAASYAARDASYAARDASYAASYAALDASYAASYAASDASHAARYAEREFQERDLSAALRKAVRT